jgi:hypothetical protein
MSVLDEVADGLAKRVTEMMTDANDDAMERRIAAEVGASSPTLQEAFTTAMRLRKAELRGHALLDMYARGENVPKAGISSAPQD